MHADRIALMPDWPARLSEELAALYLGISRPTLRDGYAAGRLPAPIREGGRIFWSRKQLDDFVEIQFGMKARKNSWDDA